MQNISWTLGVASGSPAIPDWRHIQPGALTVDARKAIVSRLLANVGKRLTDAARTSHLAQVRHIIEQLVTHLCMVRCFAVDHEMGRRQFDVSSSGL
jgi:hypothetical protein